MFRCEHGILSINISGCVIKMSLAYRVGIFQTVKTLGNGTQDITVQPDKILRYDLTNATCINNANNVTAVNQAILYTIEKI